MKTLLTSVEFRDELPGWVLRGSLCAVSSAYWAVALGFNSPEEVADMAAGVVAWMAIFAGVCVHLQRQEGRSRIQVVSALKRASWIKVWLTVLGWTLMAIGGSGGNESVMASGLLGGTDVLLGMIALKVVSFLSGLDGAHAVARADSFVWTSLATMTEGLLVALVIGFIAMLETAFRRILQMGQKKVKT